MDATFAIDSPPSPPKRLRTRIVEEEDRLHLVWPNKGKGVGVFLLVWLTGWTIGCCAIVSTLINDFQWMLMLMAIPFLAAEVFVGGYCLFKFAGRERLVVSATQIVRTVELIRPLWSREVPMEEVGSAIFSPPALNDDDETPSAPSVSISTLDHPLEFANGVSADEGEWLAALLNTWFDRLAPERPVRQMELEASDESDADEGEGTDAPDQAFEIVGPSFPAIDRPANSTWQVGHEGRAVVFKRRGRWSIGAIALATFLNAFWNGIVGVFLFVLASDFQWGMAIFLIPFVLVGAALILAWVATLLAPLGGQSYTIRLGNIVKRSSFLGVGRTRSWEFGDLQQLRIVRHDGVAAAAKAELGKLQQPDLWDLQFVEYPSNVVTSAERLTFADAKWMADTLWHNLPELFRRRR